MTETAAERKPSLLVFADDWGRHPSSCQHLISRLLPQYPVWWVNTVGMRRPSFDLMTLRRGLEKLREWFFKNRVCTSMPSNLRVVRPKMWPWFSKRRDRWLNRKLLLRSLVPLINSIPSPVVAITTVPIVADLLGRLPVDRWVYYCVDDFGTWPGLDQSALRCMEEDLLRSVDSVVAASETLQEKLAAMGRESKLLTHGVDVEFWRSSPETKPLAALSEHRRPWVVFWGVVDRRMDAAFVRRLADDMNEGTILLAGPTQTPPQALNSSPQVACVSRLPYEDLPALAAEADVLVMPYRDLPVTRAMQPLKLKEYLATNKPVVVRDLPATRPWADCLDLSRTPEEFSALVRRRVVEGLPEPQRDSRRRLAGESWTAKARQFENFLSVDLSMPAATDG